jgi:hypothetical protein
LLWAYTKSFFSFGRLRVISAKNPANAADRIRNILNQTGKKIGNIILESHAHAGGQDSYKELADAYDPATTSLAIGNDAMADRIDAKTDISQNYFFKTLKPFVTENTNVFLGNCWSACGPFQPVLVNISNYWNNASVFGQAAENRSISLFTSNSFASRGYIGSGEANTMTRGFTPRGANRIVRYNENGNIGRFFKAKGGIVTPTSIIKFGSGANIIESGVSYYDFLFR